MNSGWTKIIVAVTVLFLAVFTAQAQDNWYAQSSGTSQPLFDVCFADADNGWVVGNGAVILHTANGGNTWSEQTFDPVSNLFAIHFADPQNGWAGGYSGSIRHTMDGGQTWEIQESGTNAYIYGVYAVDAMKAWVVGGITPGFYNGSQFIRHTSDGGATWTQQHGASGYATFPLNAIHFVDANIGCAVGGGGAYGSTILFTTDGGATWTPQSAGGLLTELTDIFLLDQYTGWIVGRYGVILHTTNGGATWTPQSSPIAAWLTGVNFADQDNGWASGGTSLEAVMLHTSNGGSTWEVQDTGGFPLLYNLFILDADNGWAVGYNGTIIHTSPLPPETVAVNLGCLPTSGELPFNVTIQAALSNITGFNRTVAGRIRVDLASGGSITNYRTGFTNVAPFSSFTTSWVQNLPALFALEGTNVFTLTAEDVTAAPYNQPPYPASGDSDIDTCAVLGIVP